MAIKVPYIELLMEMLAIPAVSRNEDLRSDFLESYMKDAGFPVSRIQNNLLVGSPKRLDSRPRILLNSHMDTVSPVEGWDLDPFIPVMQGEKITGLGSNDAGASVVTLMATYGEMRERLESSLDLLLLISAEEEVSGHNGISAVLPGLDDLDGAIVGEPTGMLPAVAERGLMVIDGEVKGVAGHAARKEGENAIYKAIKEIESIKKLEFGKASEWLPEPGAQVTLISAGTSHNVVPDVCRFVVDVRSNDKYGNEVLLELIREACAAQLVPRSTRLKPSGLPENHFLMKAIHRSNLEPFGSSTLSDMALIPYPAIKMGPGDSARSHTAGEYIMKSELDLAVERYCRFLDNLKV
ncbi:MAG: acetylornithine deacetylase [Bacteroidetes bacterium]|nr:MAG: acetylornithine deacetylase [Bacteroidota bacterium]